MYFELEVSMSPLYSKEQSRLMYFELDSKERRKKAASRSTAITVCSESSSTINANIICLQMAQYVH